MTLFVLVVLVFPYKRGQILHFMKFYLNGVICKSTVSMQFHKQQRSSKTNVSVLLKMKEASYVRVLVLFSCIFLFLSLLGDKLQVVCGCLVTKTSYFASAALLQETKTRFISVV